MTNEVTVLRKFPPKFRIDFINNWIRPAQKRSQRYAVACQKYFKLLTCSRNGVISTHGYEPIRKISIQTTQWLEWENMSANIQFPHGRTKRINIGRYFVDNADEETKIVYEYSGSVFYGHSVLQ